MRRRWWDLLALAVLAGAVLFFCARLAFTNLILGHGDAYLYFAPYWAYRDAMLRAAEVPLWNPLLFMGVPFLANSQAGVLYPPNWLFLLWPDLSAPEAIKWSLIGHLMLAGVLAYVYARRTLGLARRAAWAGALLFALGGYLGMQLEHVNQVQGLVWLPALFALVTGNPRYYGGAGAAAPGARSLALGVGDRRRSAVLRWSVLAAVIALQLLAGHSQSTFVSLVGLGVYVLWLAFRRLWNDAHAAVDPRPWPGWHARALWQTARAETRALAVAARPRHALPLVYLGLAAALAVALAAAQLLPTLELSRESLRSGGLSEQEALAFSLAPPLVGRALLPAYDAAIFNEYVAYLGTAAFVLIALGVWTGRRDARTQALVAVALLGLFFALGMFNPFYRLLVRYVPGFDLFRAPARWLALWAFAGAVLAALGLNALLRARATKRAAVGASLAGFAVTAVLVLSSALATTGVRGELQLGWQPPAWPVVIAWLGVAAIAAVLVPAGALWPRGRGLIASALLPLVAVELYFGAQHMPYREPTAPQAWESVRPAMAHLLAAQASYVDPPETAPRFLSLSRAEFDPGDAGELWSAYGPSWPSDCGVDPPGRPDLVVTVNPEPILPAQAVCQLLIDTKQKEILSPNLPLAWGLPAADGYDGGVLPLRTYATFAQLLLPPGAETRDGRLRENVVDVPDGRVLSLMNVRWLITDKVGDVPYDGVFYDLRQGVTLGAGAVSTATLDVPADFEATELRVVGHLSTSSGPAPETPVLSAMVTFAGGETQWLEARAAELSGDTNGDGVARLSWGLPRRLRAVVLASRPQSGGTGQVVVRGASLVDARTGAFEMLVVSGAGRYRLAHSADVKIYENLTVLPRAFVAPEAVAADDAAALAAMRSAGWSPARTVFLAPDRPLPADLSASGPLSATLAVAQYSARRIVYDVETTAPAWLVIADSWYPGWAASVDDRNVPIFRGDILFRAVRVPAGAHRVRLTFDSPAWESGLTASLLAAGFLIARLAWEWRRGVKMV